MQLNEYAQFDAVGLAQEIGNGTISASEAQDAARAALEAVNPSLNAIVGDLFEEPLAHSDDGPFRGVPFLIKDLGVHAAGVPSFLGSRLTGESGVVASFDSDLVSRFRKAGLAMLGRTTTPEFAWCTTTEPLRTGITRNPWDLERSPGGSSGGSAVLVAARAVPMAHANDAGGSIRMPAAWCGVVGLKPTRGRVPVGPEVDDPVFFGLQHEFALTRTVRDAACLLDAVQGGSPGDKYVALPDQRFQAGLSNDPGSLRVAVAPQGCAPTQVYERGKAAVARVGEQLEALGHQVSLAAPDFEHDELIEPYVRMAATGLAQQARLLARERNVDLDQDVLEATILGLVELGSALNATAICDAEMQLTAVRREFGAFFEGVDVLVTPTMASEPCRLGYLDANDSALSPYQWQRRNFHLGPFAWPFNITGQPAISVPVPADDHGLPVGVQLVARPGDELTLLRVARQLEQALPWSESAPPVAVGAPSG